MSYSEYLKQRNLKQFIEQKFDELFDLADNILKKYNPCGIKKVNGNVSCHGCGNHHILKNIFIERTTNTLCCSGCRFHDTICGCTAEKPLMCKLWLCNTVTLNFPDVDTELENLRNQASKMGFCGYRLDKKELLKKSFNINKIHDKNFLDNLINDKLKEA